MEKGMSLSVREVTKSFAGVKALDHVSLELAAGRVHGLIGANGAGKSTLIKILAGVYQADGGTICVNGTAVSIAGPGDSAALGLSFIHQELHLVEHFTVAENLLLGLPKVRRLGLIDWKRTAQGLEHVLGLVSFTKPVSTPVKELSVGEQWRVAIAKALYQDVKFIAMDEPTAALSESEVKNLFSIVRDLTARGIGVIYVSHRLDEVMQLCDEITVFKDGRTVMHDETKNLSKEAVVTAIAGHKVESMKALDYRFQDAPVLLRVTRLLDEKMVRDLSFVLKEGEVLGLTGLVGSGRTEAVMAIYGAARLKGGEMELNGRPYRPKAPSDAVKNRVVLVPEDRRGQGLVTNQTVDFNINLPTLQAQRLHRLLPLLSPGKGLQATRQAVDALQIKTSGPRAQVLSLSGGNQQKVVIGKWLKRRPKLIIMDEPTQGVDVGARAEIYRLIREMARRDKTSFLIVSSDIEELPGLCDRVLVMAEGRLTGELTGGRITGQAMLRLCYAAKD